MKIRKKTYGRWVIRVYHIGPTEVKNYPFHAKQGAIATAYSWFKRKPRAFSRIKVYDRLKGPIDKAGKDGNTGLLFELF